MWILRVQWFLLLRLDCRAYKQSVAKSKETPVNLEKVSACKSEVGHCDAWESIFMAGKTQAANDHGKWNAQVLGVGKHMAGERKRALREKKPQCSFLLVDTWLHLTAFSERM